MARPVSLKSEVDRLKLRQLLDDALGAELQELERSGQASPTLVACLKARTDKMHRRLERCITIGARPQEAPEVPAADELMEDAELAALQAEVDSAWQRALQLRASVPAAIQQRVEQQLVQLRPEEMDADLPAPEAPGAAPELAPSAAELQMRLSGAAGKIPTLRAKLTEALERLGRVVQALEGVEAAAATAVPPTPTCTITAAPQNAAAAKDADFRKHLAGALQLDGQIC